jgi:hypothetical protein
MRYKVVKETHICDDKPVSSYYVMYEKKVWWKKNQYGDIVKNLIILMALLVVD